MSNSSNILFVAEAVTLAHVARPAVLAQGLDPQRYSISFAMDSRYSALFPELQEHRQDIHSVPSDDFLKALAQGKPIYSEATLAAYVEEDLALIDRVNPDVIVGDFRLSLSISARLRNIPYAAITNTWWCDNAPNRYAVPDLPVTRLLGARTLQPFFPLVLPAIFALHTRPMNRVRRRFGLDSLGLDLRTVYSDADYQLLADLPAYFPLPQQEPRQHYLGPLPWSPTMANPPEWEQLNDKRPVIYVTLGSSGPSDLLPMVLQALASLPVTVIAATAGRCEIYEVPHNTLLSCYVPGDTAASMASLVISNGGSLSTYQALARGTPVLGIASNLDQHLNMSYLANAGLGKVIRSEQASIANIAGGASKMLEQDCYTKAAQQAQQDLAAQDPHARFQTFLQGITSASTLS